MTAAVAQPIRPSSRSTDTKAELGATAGLPSATAALTLLAIGIWLVPGASELLEYRRGAITSGEFWRAVTGNLTHWNADHLLWDALMFAVLGALIERTSRRALLATCIVSAAAISAVLWFCQPGLELYRGLSGIDSALFVFQAGWLVREALRECRRAAAILPTVALLGFVGKIGYELVTGATLFVDSAAAGFAPLPLAHVIGGVVGLLIFGVFVRKRDMIDNRDIIHQPRRPLRRFILKNRHSH
jgi:rhomboid family GlyGly-CTERM serine protease